MKKSEVVALFDKWNNALQTRDPAQMTALYANDAILLPTISNQICHNHEEIRNYFELFLQKKPKGVINESNIRIFDELAINSGIYTISCEDNTHLKARFTFLYKWNGKQWLIIEHHSSKMPE